MGLWVGFGPGFTSKGESEEEESETAKSNGKRKESISRSERRDDHLEGRVRRKGRGSVRFDDKVRGDLIGVAFGAYKKREKRYLEVARLNGAKVSEKT